jgi:hypothetical protein
MSTPSCRSYSPLTVGASRVLRMRVKNPGRSSRRDEDGIEYLDDLLRQECFADFGTMKSPIKKETIVRELKELLSIILYLACSFAVLATIKSIVLIQVGVNNFVHGYIVAVVEALALGKVVLIAQNLKFMKAMNKKPIVRSAFIKCVIMSTIVFMAGHAEERMFAHHVADAHVKDHLSMQIAHFLSLLFIFYVLFVARELDHALGPGRMKKLLFEDHSATGSTEDTNN